MNRSLVRRLLTQLLVASGLAMLAAGALLWWQFDNAASLVADRGLGRKVEEVRASIEVAPDGRLTTNLAVAARAAFGDKSFFTVTDGRGEAFLSVPPGRGHSFHPFTPDLDEGPQYFEHSDLRSGENFVGVTVGAVLDKQAYWIQLVEVIPGWQNFLHHSLQVYVIGIGLVIVLHFLGTSLLTYRSLKRSLAPVERAAAQASAISPGQRHIRIDAGVLPAEVVPLATAVNSALERLEQALAAQKRFTADAAHELLTPLAIVKADIDAIQDREVARRLENDIEEMVGLVTQLLELSEIESEERPPDQLFDLRESARDALLRLAPLAIRRGLEPEISGAEEPVFVRGCPRAMSTAIGNLVKNAITHATGATRLVVSVEHGGTVTVTDEGPGIPADLRERIFERFHRIQGTKSTGKGLGLAIVDRIVAAHGGRVWAEEAPGGKGARFVIQLRR